MKANKFLIFSLLALFLSSTYGISQAQDSFLEGQVLIRIVEGASADSVALEIGGEVADSTALGSIFLLTFSPAVPVEIILGQLASIPVIQIAQPNYSIGLPEIQQMSISFPDQRQPVYTAGTSPSSLYLQPAVYDIGIDSAHILGEGDGTVVAVVDNGADLSHPYLQEFLHESMYDFIEKDSLPDETLGDAYGHGTFVAGLVRLVAPKSTLMPLKAFDGDGYGTTFSVVQAISYATLMGADVINMSFILQDDNPSLEAACAEAADSGAVLVAAAGNLSSSIPVYPAAYEDVIAVSAIDTLDLLADFSSYGGHIDVCAPGVCLYSSLAGEYDWGTWSGTSFAAPLVSGAAALVEGIRPIAVLANIEDHLRQTAATTLLWGSITPPDQYFGYGRINTYHSLLSCSHGNVNGVDGIDVSDLTLLVNYLFLNASLSELSYQLADVDCSVDLNISDLTSLVSFLFGDSGEIAPCYYY